MLDVDRMIIDTSMYAAPDYLTLPAVFNGSLIRIYTEDVGLHTGYVRLIQEKDKKELRLDDLHKLKLGKNVHRPAILRNHKPSVMDHSNRTLKFHDDVFAIHSPYWPDEATEWITRRRLCDFPLKSVIKQIVNYGCDFVQISHKFSNRIEWRFSFSRAELFITKSAGTLSQQIVYTTLWVLNKKKIGSMDIERPYAGWKR